MRKGLFYISGILIFTSLLSSCVSKKKYEELARAKGALIGKWQLWRMTKNLGIRNAETER